MTLEKTKIYSLPVEISTYQLKLFNRMPEYSRSSVEYYTRREGKEEGKRIRKECNEEEKTLNGMYQIFEKMAIQCEENTQGKNFFYESREIYLGINKISHYWWSDVLSMTEGND